MRRVEFQRVDWEFAATFRIAYRTRSHAEAVQVALTEGEWVGRGEGFGVSYHGETADSVVEQLHALKSDLVNGLSREALQTRLPAGGARNAIDCALWDLEAKRAGRRAWEIAGFSSVHPLITDYTLSLDTPEAMARAAAALPQYKLLKLKLAGGEDLERVAAVRHARPDVELIVDANQGWEERHLERFPSQLAALGVQMIEQPLPAGKDDALAHLSSPIPFCADESCQTTDSLPSLRGKYQYVNIKLDKTGGLTEALRLAYAARAENFQLMIGSMAGGSSLSMAPAFIIGQLCRYADLDGPLLCKTDVPYAIKYEGSMMFAPETRLWG